MNEQTYPWTIYDQVIPSEICDHLAEYCDELKKFPGLIGQQNNTNSDYRNTLIGFLPEDHWMMGVFYHYTAIQNVTKWKYDLSGPAPVQYAEYSKDNRYKWHSDSGDIPLNAETIRKITCILQLTDGHNFKGGDLQLRLGTDTEDIKVFSFEEMRNKGSLVIFPSSISHQVTNVIDGMRKTLTCWILGTPFR